MHINCLIQASDIIRAYPMSPRQTVTYWIEHVIKHGHDHLHSPAAGLIWYQYFMIDVVMFIGIVTILAIVFFISAIRLVRKMLPTKLKLNQN